MLSFEWDPEKAKNDHKKHGVNFEEASTVFYDALSATFDDQRKREENGTVVHAHKLGNSFGMITKTKGGPNAILRSGCIKALDSYLKRVRENQS